MSLANKEGYNKAVLDSASKLNEVERGKLYNNLLDASKYLYKLDMEVIDWRLLKGNSKMDDVHAAISDALIYLK
tara:strand:+ start:1067 stop:1288 length:222 start_codon:yes stop_codon:yes gene_type:complete